MDKTGAIRYVIGQLESKNRAEQLLAMVMDAGYKDAFIVDINKERKYTEEIVVVDRERLKKPKVKDYEFKIQIGAFKEDSIPSNLMEMYLKLDGMEEHKQNDLTIVTTGSFNEYHEAQKHKEFVSALGIPGPFVIAFEDNKKVSTKEVSKYLEKQKSVLKN